MSIYVYKCEANNIGSTIFFLFKLNYSCLFFNETILCITMKINLSFLLFTYFPFTHTILSQGFLID